MLDAGGSRPCTLALDSDKVVIYAGNMATPPSYRVILEELTVDLPLTAESIRQLSRYVWNDNAASDAWLKSPHPQLDGQPPEQTLETEDGARRVATLLRKIYFGLPV